MYKNYNSLKPGRFACFKNEMGLDVESPPVSSKKSTLGMWTVLFLAFLFTLVGQQSWAQAPATYVFSATSGTYTPITIAGGATSAGTYIDSGKSDIPGLAGFTVNGVTYTNYQMSSNGILALYTTTAPTTTTTYTALSSAITNAAVVIAPFAVDLAPSTVGTSAYMYQQVGDELVFQWENVSRYSFSGNNDSLNFQVRLNTVSGDIQFVYGECVIGSNPTGSPQVGFRTTTTFATDVNNVLINVTGSPATCNWSNAVSGYSNSSSMYMNNANPGVKPLSGLTYTWSKQNTTSYVSPVRTFSAVSGISANAATLSWTAPANATQYDVQYRPVGSCTWIDWNANPVTANTVTLTGLSSGTAYQARVRASDGTNYSNYSHIPNAAGNGDGYAAAGTFSTQVTCFPVTAVTTSDVTATSATVTWVAPTTATPSEGYQWEIRTSGAAGSGATGLAAEGTATANELSFSVATLTNATSYTVYVRSNCGEGDFSAWASKAFKTETLIPTPWVEGFTTTVMPSGWTNVNYANIGSVRGAAGNPGNNIYKNLDGTSTTGSFTTANYGPIGADYTLSFDYKVSNYSATASVYAYPGDNNWGNFVVAISTDFGQTWDELETVSTAEAGWNSLSYTLANYVGLNIKVRISATRTAGDFDLAFDNFAIQVPPSCLIPSAITVQPIGVTSADFSWVESLSGPANGYQWEIRTSDAAGSGATGLVDSGSTAAGVTAASSALLVNNTTYLLYVRAHCGTDEFSAWTEGKSFKTQIALPTPWSEGFATTTLPTGWVNSGFSMGTATSTGGNPGTTIYKNLHSGATTGNFTTVNYGPIAADQSLLFDYKVANFSSPYAYLETGWSFTVQVSTDYGVSWEDLDPVNTGVAGWNSISFPLQAYAGMYVKIRITGNRTAGDFNMAFDNFAIQVPPTCLPTGTPATTAVGGTTATVAWSESVSAPMSGYAYEVRTSGAAGSGETGLIDEGTTEAGEVSADLSGLTPTTAYVFYVRANCGNDDFSAWKQLNFTTGLANDICADAIVIACGSSTVTSLVGSTNESHAVCGISGVNTQNSGGIWYKIAGTGENMTVSTGSSATAVDTRLAVFTGECGALNCIGGNDDLASGNLRSEVVFPTTDGQDYYVLLYSYSATTPTAAITLTLTCAPACTPANTNDLCVDAELIEIGVPLDTNNLCATPSMDITNPSCGSTFGTYYDSWYVFDSGNNTALQISTTAVAPTVVGYVVYTGDCGAVTPVTGSCSLTGANTIITVTPNTIYYVRASSVTGAKGDFTLKINVPCLVPTAVVVDELLATGVTLSWTASVTDPANGYEYEIRTSGAAGSGSTGLADFGSVVGGEVTATSTILTPETAYTFYVRSSCGPDHYSTWVSKTFTTNPACMKPTGLQVAAANITQNSAVVSWTAPATAPGEGYEYYVSQVNTAPTVAGTFTADLEVSLDLDDSTVYYVWVRSVCGDGLFSSWTASVKFTTLCSAGTVPYALTVSSTTETPLCIIVENTNGDNQQWIPYAAQDGIQGNVMSYRWHTSNAANDWFFLKGLDLDPGVTYRLQFKYKHGAFVEKLKVAIGDSPVSGAMDVDNPLFDVVTTNVGSVGTVDEEFTVAADGVYYIGFHAYSDANMLRLSVGEISVTEMPLSTPGFDLSKLSYYPNPVKDVLTLNYADTIDTVEVFNIIGQKVYQNDFASTEAKVDMNKLPAGTYIVNVVSKGLTKNIKVIKN